MQVFVLSVVSFLPAWQMGNLQKGGLGVLQAGINSLVIPLLH